MHHSSVPSERIIPLSRPIDAARYNSQLSALNKGLVERGLPVSMLEKRKGDWMVDIDVDDFFIRLDSLIKEGTWDQSDDLFYFGESLSEDEWNAIVAVRSGLQGERIEGLEEDNTELSDQNTKLTRIAAGASLLALAFLFSNLFDGKKNPSGEVFPPAQVEKLTDEQIEFLRQQMEFFLQENQQIQASTEQ